jgi:hypothetical protein
MNNAIPSSTDEVPKLVTPATSAQPTTTVAQGK